MNAIENRIKELAEEHTKRLALRGQHSRELEIDDKELAKIEVVLGELTRLLQTPPTGADGKEGDK